MSAPSQCQGCSARTGERLKYRPQGERKPIEVTVRLERYRLLDFGDRLLCQRCLALAKTKVHQIQAGGRIVAP